MFGLRHLQLTSDYVKKSGHERPICVGERERMEPLKFIESTDTELILDGPIALFGGADIVGERFEPETDFESNYTKTGRLLIDWEHGTEPDVDEQGQKIAQPGRDDILGYVDWLTKRTDDIGLLARHVLDRSARYVSEFIEPLARAGLLGSSSEATEKGVIREDDGLITRWPLKRQSLTVMPMEPRLLTDHQLEVVKSLAEAHPFLKTLIPEAAGTAATDSVTAGEPEPPLQEPNTMTELTKEDVAKLVAEETSKAVKAEAEKRAAAEDARREQEAREKEIAEEAVKAHVAKQPPADPFGVAPAIVKDTSHWKYDNTETGDLAVLAGVLSAAQKKTPRQVNPAMVKALAMRLESDEARKNEAMSVAGHNMKMAGIVKANETDFSTNVGYGDEWVGVAYSGALWESIRVGTFVVDRFVRPLEFPAGAESMVIPLESTDPIWYTVAQAGDPSSGLARITNTVTASGLGTSSVTMTLAKLGARTWWTGEMVEDAVLPFVNQLRMQIAVSGAEYLESAVIDGDTETSASTNINDIAGTPAATDWFMVWNGLRKSPLITTTANSRDGGVLTSSDFLETAKLMGGAGINALDRDRVSFIIDPSTHYKALELTDVKTRDVFNGATIEGGRLTGMYGYGIDVSGSICKADSDRLSNSAGKVDVDTVANNTKGSILAVRWDQWQFGYRRRMTLETERVAPADAWQIVALLRAGLIQRDTEASAISYNITV
jgi:hypothetical protein